MAGKAGPDISENGIVLYLDAKNEKSYSGNAVWKDLSGNNNSGSMYTGKCAKFNGSTSNITIANNSVFDFGSGSYTLCAWARISSPQSINAICGQGLSGAYPIKSIYVDSSGYFKGAVEDSEGHNVDSTADGGTWADGLWHLFACVFSYGDAMYRYIDGNAIGTNDSISATGPTDSTAHFYIGAYTIGATGNWNDQISDVKIFNTSLSSTQISELYSNPNKVLPTGISGSQLVGYWPLSEGYGTIAHDGSGNQNHGTLSGSAIPTWVSGSTTIPQLGGKSYNKPMVFDGSSNYVEVSNDSSIAPTTQGTIGIWIKNNDTLSESYVYDKNINTNGMYGLIARSDSTIDAYIYASGLKGVSNVSITQGEWTHFAEVWSTTADSMILYKNGSQVDSVSLASATPSSSGFDLHIGKQQNGASGYFDGLINEFAIWDTALDAESVALLAASSSVGLPLPPDANTISGSNLVGYWRNDGDTTWTDRSSNNNTGSVNGSPDSIFLPEGIYADRDSQGFPIKEPNTGWITFDGNADYVSCGDVNDMSTIDFSYGCWIRSYNSGSAPEDGIISKRSGTAGYQFYRLNNTTNVAFFMGDIDGNWASGTYSDVIDGTWHNIFVSISRTNNLAYRYKDSIFVGTTSLSSVTASIDNNAILEFGREFANNIYCFDGQISQPKIYNQALSQAEITQNYNAMKSRYA